MHYIKCGVNSSLLQ